MKQTFTLLLCISSLHLLADNCTATATGNWGTAGNWSCGHIPTTGDYVTIPTGVTITVTANYPALLEAVYIGGTLTINNTQSIALSSTAIVQVYTGGTLNLNNGSALLDFPLVNYNGPLSQAGPYFYTNSSSGSGVLPVKINSFTVTNISNNNEVKWVTESESSILYYEIEWRNTTNSTWQVINKTVSYNNSSKTTYSYAHLSPANGNNFYRIKITEINGEVKYSGIIQSLLSAKNKITVFPTLVTNSLNFTTNSTSTINVTITNSAGTLVKSLVLKNLLEYSIDIANLTKGIYLVTLLQNMDKTVTRVIKQ